MNPKMHSLGYGKSKHTIGLSCTWNRSLDEPSVDANFTYLFILMLFYQLQLTKQSDASLRQHRILFSFVEKNIL